jgi:hypothetical protein
METPVYLQPVEYNSDLVLNHWASVTFYYLKYSIMKETVMSYFKGLFQHLNGRINETA